MEKAYDLKELGKMLKSEGLDIAEESLKIVIEKTFDWATESAGISKTPYDDMLALAYPSSKKYILEQVDKIDGEVG